MCYLTSYNLLGSGFRVESLILGVSLLIGTSRSRDLDRNGPGGGVIMLTFHSIYIVGQCLPAGLCQQLGFHLPGTEVHPQDWVHNSAKHHSLCIDKEELHKLDHTAANRPSQSRELHQVSRFLPK